MRRILPLLPLLLLACGSGEPEGSFSPLIGGEGVEHYDIFVANVPTIRGTELAPGAAPARPVVDGAKATRRMHLLATYGADVTPGEIVELMAAGLEDVDFLAVLTEAPMAGGEGELGRSVAYETPDGRGSVTITVRATDRPNRLEILVEVEEELVP